MFLVAEEAALADDLGDLRWDHVVPVFVAGGNAFEHVPGKDRQIFGIIVIQLHEAAATAKIVVEQLDNYNPEYLSLCNRFVIIRLKRSRL